MPTIVGQMVKNVSNDGVKRGRLRPPAGLIVRLSLALLIAIVLAASTGVVGWNSAEARGIWLGSQSVKVSDGMNPGEAVITWDRLADGSHYRIGWAPQDHFAGQTDAGLNWREGFSFTDVDNEGQATHLVTGLTPGAEYHFVVASHEGGNAVVPAPTDVATLRLADRPPAPSDDPSRLGFHVPRPVQRHDFPEIWKDFCYAEYCIYVPTGYFGDDAELMGWVAGLKGGLADKEDRAKFYREILLEMILQPVTGDAFVRFEDDAVAGFAETMQGEPLTDPEDFARATHETVGAISLAYDIGETAQLLNNFHYLHEHGGDAMLGLNLVGHGMDVFIALTANRVIDLDQAQERLKFLDRHIIVRAIYNDPAWGPAFLEVKKDLERMADKARWMDVLFDKFEEVLEAVPETVIKGLATTATKAVAGKVAVALGVKVVLVANPITLLVGLAVIAAIDLIQETTQFWDESIRSVTALQVYLAMTNRDDQEKQEIDEHNFLDYATFAFYHHLHKAMGTSFVLVGLDLKRFKSHRFSVMEKRDRTLAGIIDSDWTPGKDFNSIMHPSGDVSSLGKVRGIWSDGRWVRVLKDYSNAAHFFDRVTDGPYDAQDAGSVDQLGLNQMSFRGRMSFRGLWADGTTMWASSIHGISAHDYETGRRVPDKDVIGESILPDDYLRQGIWADTETETMWVAYGLTHVFGPTDGVYAYDMESGKRLPTKDFNTLNAAGNDAPRGIWSDGETMWVVDETDHKVYAYSMATKKREPSREFDLVNVPAVVDNGGPSDIWSDGTTMWVGDVTDEKIYAYRLPPKPTSPAEVSDAQVGATTQIYWIDADTGAIRRANADGSGAIENLITSGDPTSLALDLAAGKLYWTDTAAGKIKWADLNDFSSHHDLYSSERPTNLALDAANGDLYWTDQVPGSIRRANADGSSSEPEILVLQGLPTSLALDPANRDMYWTDGATGKIRRAKMDRSMLDPIDDLAADLIWPDNLALDLAQGQMYWTEWAPGRIRRASLHGAGNSSIENLVGFTSGLPTGLALDLPGDKMYWTDGVNHTIRSSDLTGTDFAITDVFSASNGLSAPEGIAVAPGLTVLKSVPQLYWVDEEAQKIQRTGGDDYRTVLDQLTSEHGLNMPGSIALDPVSGKMYWTDDGAGQIRRADLDGSNIENLVSGLADPVGVALDLTAGRLYWADRHHGAIYRGALRDITQEGLLPRHESIVANLDKPYQIALDTVNGHMYWTERGQGTSKIRRADLDGNNVTDVAFGLVAPLNPFGLALDPVAGKMYWTERSTVSNGEDVITRADFDGKNGEIVVTSAYHSLSGIAVDVNNGRIYWTDEQVGTIRRIDPDDPNRAAEDVITGLSSPEGIAIAGPYLGSTRLALTALYRATGGPQGEWEDSDKWLSDEPFGEWHGITTLDELGESTTDLVELDLSDNGLTGELPGALGNLNQLESLDLSGNRLSGPIPEGLAGGLDVLKTLDLSDNDLSGWIPAGLGNQHLTRLSLSNNRLTGSIPPELGNRLVSLRRLDLSANGLGLDPQSLSDLAALPISFEVPIPASLGNLESLEVLDLSDNWFGGAIPASLGALPNLEILNLSDNALTWNIPGELGNLSNLRVLDLSGNQLFGKIPPELSYRDPVCFSARYPGPIGSLANLRALYLNDNNLSEEIPIGLCALTTLKYVDLGDNRLSGSIPVGLGNLSELTGLDLSLNSLTGSIPNSLGNFRSLRSLDLHGNDLSGQIPEELSQLPLVFLDLYDNQLNQDKSWCIPFSNDSAERLRLHPGHRNLPSALCSTVENRRGLGSLYVVTAPDPQIDELKALLGVKFRLGEIENVIEHEIFNHIGPHGITAETFAVLARGRDGDNDQSILNDISDEQVISIWVAILQRLYAHMGIADLYRPAVVDRLDYSNRLPSGHMDVLIAMFEGFQFTGHQLNPHHLLEDFRKYAGWKNNDNWLSHEDLGEWYGVTTNDAGHVIGLDLSHNNLRGYIPLDLLEGLPHLKWLNIRGNMLNGACISPDLLPLLLAGDIVSRSPEKFGTEELDILSEKTDEELYQEFVDTLEGEEGSDWLDIFYGHVMVGQAAGALAEAGLVTEEDAKSVIDKLTEIPSNQKIFQKTARGIFKIPDGKSFGVAAKAIGPIMNTANRMLQYEVPKQGAALCPPEAPTGDTDGDGDVEIEELDRQNYETDRNALITLYVETGGATGSWKNVSGWDTIGKPDEKPMGEWHGVHTERVDGAMRVTAINLGISRDGAAPWNWRLRGSSRDGNGLAGPIPPELGSLGQLKSLNLSQNELTGPIPPELGNLENLLELSLNDNRLSNYDVENDHWNDPPIPPELGNLIQLKDLHLQGNELRGWIPMELSMLSLGRLRKANLTGTANTSCSVVCRPTPTRPARRTWSAL